MIGAIVLAAGQSRRMGRPKMVLPWGSTTVIGRVVGVLAQAGIEPVIVITGGSRELVEAALLGLPARPVFNPRFESDEMTWSLQTGLAAMPEDVEAALVVLGDQPQIEPRIVAAVVAAYRKAGPILVVPSYEMRRGHPWLVSRALWPAILALQPPQTLRDLLHASAEQIHYLVVDTPSVLRDLDTPDDYERERPAGNPAE
jgi:molybdenum cofactor cytidylyltransferase